MRAACSRTVHSPLAQACPQLPLDSLDVAIAHVLMVALLQRLRRLLSRFELDIGLPSRLACKGRAPWSCTATEPAPQREAQAAELPLWGGAASLTASSWAREATFGE
jgi:hypothetical protein